MKDVVVFGRQVSLRPVSAWTSLGLLVTSLFGISAPSAAVEQVEVCTATVPTTGDLQGVIDTASSGDVICLEAGTYDVNLNLDASKSLSLVGLGASTVLAGSAIDVPRVTISSSSNSAGPLLIKNLKVANVQSASSDENSGSGIYIASNGNAIDGLVIDGVTVEGNGGHGIAFNSSPIYNIAIRNSQILDNAGTGIRIASAVTTLDGLEVSNSLISLNNGPGVSVNPNQTTSNLNTDVVLSNVRLVDNNATAGDNKHEVSVMAFRGTLSMTSVDIESGSPNTAHVIAISGPSSAVDAGAITLDDVDISGQAVKAALLFQNFKSLAAVSLNDIDFRAVNAQWGDLIASHVGPQPLQITNSFIRRVETWSTGGVDATTSTFFRTSDGVELSKAIPADNFQIARQVKDGSDLNHTFLEGFMMNTNAAFGVVRWLSNTLFVANETLYIFFPSTGVNEPFEPSIKRAVLNSTSGDTIYVESGTYNENIVIDKALNLKCANFGVAGNATRGPESKIEAVSTDSTPALTIRAANVVVDGCKFVRPNVISTTVTKLIKSETVTGRVDVKNSVFDMALTGTSTKGRSSAIYGTANWHIENNFFTNQAYSSQYESRIIYIDNGSPVLIKNNEFISSDHAVFIVGASGSNNGSVIEGNIFTQTAPAIAIGAVSDVIIKGNTFRRGNAIFLDDSRRTIVENNLFCGGLGGGVEDPNYPICSHRIGYAVWFDSGVQADNVVRQNAILGAYPFYSEASGYGLYSLRAMFNFTANSALIEDNWWGIGFGETEIRAKIYESTAGTLPVSRWITSYSFDPARSGDAGFWPINVSTVAGLSSSDVSQDVVIYNPEAGNPAITVPPSSGPVSISVTALSADAVSGDVPFTLTGAILIDIDIQGSFEEGAEIIVCVEGNAPSRLWHFVNDEWVDITVESLSVGGKICGSVTSFSPFALAPAEVPTPTTTDVAATPSDITIGETTEIQVDVAGSADIGDPTGSVDVWYCFSPTVDITTCDAAESFGSIDVVSIVDDLNPDGMVSFSFDFAPEVVGKYLVVADYLGDDSYAPSRGFAGVTVSQGETVLTYTGPNYSASTDVVLRATISAPDICKAGKTVDFYADLDGDGFGDETPIGSVSTDSNGDATLTYTFLAGSVFEVRVEFLGDDDCTSASDVGTLLIAGMGDSSHGGGFYTDSGKSNFGYTAQVKTNKKTGVTTVSGQVLWIYKGETKVKGDVTGYAKLSCSSLPEPYRGITSSGFAGSCGVVTATARVFEWDADLEDWVMSDSGVNIVLYVADGYVVSGGSKKRGGTQVATDYFAITSGSYNFTGESTGFNQVKGGNVVVK